MSQPPNVTPPGQQPGQVPTNIDPQALAQAMAYLQAQQAAQGSQAAPQGVPGTVNQAAPTQAPQMPVTAAAAAAEDKPKGRLARVLAPATKKPKKGKGAAGQSAAEEEKDGKGEERKGFLAKMLAPANKNGKTKNSALKRAQVYGGNRRSLMLAVGGVGLAVIMSGLALLTAANAVTKSDVAAEVSDQLEQQGAGFPTGQAVQWAGQVVRVLGTYDEDARDDYANQVSQFLSSNLDTNAGWNGKGSQQVTYVSLNPEPNVLDGSHAIVTAAYQVQDGSWKCEDIPVFAYKPSTYGDDTTWAFTLYSLPTPTSCGARTGLPNLPESSSTAKEDDDTAQTLATDFFPSFFSAWAASDDATLAQYTIDGLTTVGLGGSMQSTPPPTIGDVSLLVDNKGTGSTAVATVEVTWTVADSTAQVTTTYQMDMKRVGSKWLVASEPLPAEQSKTGNSTSIPAPDASQPAVDYSSDQPTPAAAQESATVGATQGSGDGATTDTSSSDEEARKAQPKANDAG